MDETEVDLYADDEDFGRQVSLLLLLSYSEFSLTTFLGEFLIGE